MKEIAEKLRKFIGQSGISQNEFAKTIGVSGATISGIMKENYPLGDELKGKILNYIDNYNKNPVNTQEWVLANTNDFTTMRFVIDETVCSNDMAVLFGNPGTGKTESLKAYARANPAAVLIETVSNMTAAQFIRKTALLLGADAKKSKFDTLESICEHLKRRDAVILVDEAENLSLESLEHIRRIWDFTKTPVIIAGTDVLLKNLKGATRELAQIYSRIALKWHATGITKEEAEDIATLNGLDGYGEMIWQYTDNPRDFWQIAKKVIRFSKAYNKPLSKELVEQAKDMTLFNRKSKG